jgi:hypothetical protein
LYYLQEYDWLHCFASLGRRQGKEVFVRIALSGDVDIFGRSTKATCSFTSVRLACARRRFLRICSHRL